MHVWNIGLLQQGYMELHPRRLSPSYSIPWEPQISLSWRCLITGWWQEYMDQREKKGCRKMHKKEFHNLYSSLGIIRLINYGEWECCHKTCTEETTWNC
jgi:hypothetical protein